MTEIEPASARIGLGLGSNLGDSAAHLRRAVELLRQAGVQFDALSSLYRSPPWGVLDQPEFVNACALARTTLEPLALLDLVQKIEKAMGRRKTRRWGPRLIDIDVLFYGDAAFRHPRLTLPHEAILQRAFVLAPLAEIAPDLVIGGQTVSEALAGVDSAGLARIGAF
jgi:2-amino-4-hydroxy-6-hydroxymethyldihydropteridine diphosphokinase